MSKLFPKPTVSVDDMAHEAARLLRLAGFELHCASRYTEACYYRFPGRSALLRVATHAKRKSIISGDVIEAITFRGTHLDGPQAMKLHSHKFELIVWRAIGRYMINSTEYEIAKVTRFEVTDETGRVYVRDPVAGDPVKVSWSIQDEGRTLKVFVAPRHVKADPEPFKGVRKEKRG